MPYTPQLEFANFVLTFGREHVLSDFLSEIVVPAFRSTKERPYGSTTYVLNDVAIVNLGSRSEPDPAIVGKFIKDTILRRHQTYDRVNRRLEKDEQSMRTSPSSTFALPLTSHKLLYLRDVSDAPGFDAFRSTIQKFLNDAYFAYINTEHTAANSRRKENDPKISKKAIKDKFPGPELGLIPFFNELELTAQIRRFTKITRVQITVTRPNAEPVFGNFFDQIEQGRVATGARKSTAIEEDKEGMSTEGVVEQVAAPSKAAQADVKVFGQTPGGGTATVSQDTTRAREPVMKRT